MHKVLELVLEAVSEDARNEDHKGFDAAGFSSFFPEEQAETVKEAWNDYCSFRSGHCDLDDLISHYAVQS